MSNEIDTAIGKLNQQLALKIEEAFVNLPVGWLLCIHDDLETTFDLIGDTTIGLTVHYHAIRSADKCVDYRRKSQYAKNSG